MDEGPLLIGTLGRNLSRCNTALGEARLAPRPRELRARPNTRTVPMDKAHCVCAIPGRARHSSMRGMRSTRRATMSQGRPEPIRAQAWHVQVEARFRAPTPSAGLFGRQCHGQRMPNRSRWPAPPRIRQAPASPGRSARPLGGARARVYAKMAVRSHLDIVALEPTSSHISRLS